VVRPKILLLFLGGCAVGWLLGASLGKRPPQPPPTLALILRERGISSTNLAQFRFVGDESSYTSGRVATDTNVTWIWDRMIATAEPYSHWLPSGYRRVEVFTNGQPQAAAAVLFVNETDATHVEGDTRRFMCHGLADHAMHLLARTSASPNP
jgi:hypothetical protein